LGVGLSPGKHVVTVRVDNRLKVGVGINAHSVSDHTQGNWNGLVGDLSLALTDPAWIEDVQVYPQVADKQARVVVQIQNATGQSLPARIQLQAVSRNLAAHHRARTRAVELTLNPGENRHEFSYPLGEQALLWDEFQPALYDLEVRLNAGSGAARVADRRSVTFGLRELGTQGTRFTINGRPMFLRGTLECCIFPLTGYPPTDVATWMRLIEVCQAYGLNHIRFHSWCPPEAAFVAADQLGFYFHVECASWANSGSTVGDGHPIDAWLYAESERIVKAYGNHPSFVLLAYGNEPAGKRQNEYLGAWINHWKRNDPRRLYTSGAGWPILSENQYHSTPAPRIQQWGQGLESRINAKPPETVTDYREFVAQHRVPVVSHEIGQWCVYPNFDEIPKYQGYLKARNFEIFRDDLIAKGMGDQARDFLLASGKLQALCYKEEIESALRTPGFGGFQLLDLHDFPGQGTALVGVLDPFWDTKGYIVAEQHRRYCNETVPLVRMAKRTWTTADTFQADLEVAHFGPQPISPAILDWQLVDASGQVFDHGSLPPQTIPIGNGRNLGTITASLAKYPAARKYRLVVGLRNTRFENDWDLWIYPSDANLPAPTGVLVTPQWDSVARARLADGGQVLLLVPPAQVKTPVKIGFSSIFWNTAWTHGQAPHTLGILCQPDHPALKGFPTEYHSNWQWWELISRSAALVMDDLPRELRPLVQVIDDWTTHHRLGLVFEARIGKGKLLVCSIDLDQDLERRPAARHLRRCLIHYLQSPEFNPHVTLTPESVQACLFGDKP
jgi:hypothetical protein